VPTISLTETQTFTALRTFLLGAVLPDTDVIKAQVNRVPEPLNSDFVIMTPLRQERLETNETTFADNILTGAITGTTLTVSAITRAATPLGAGMMLVDIAAPPNLAAGTTIVEQATGSPPGGIGTYVVVPAQTVAQETMYAGVRSDLAATEMVVQLDFHGPNSGSNVRIIDTLFRSEYGTSEFYDIGFAVTPLFCENARQMNFVNDQQQYEDRWSMEAHLQINAIVGTQQMFADELEVTTIEVNARVRPVGQSGELDFSNPDNSGLIPGIAA
jgi:hypothetical protein